MPTTAVNLPAALEKFVDPQVRGGPIATGKLRLLRQCRSKSVAASSAPGYSRKSRRASTPDRRVNSILKTSSGAVVVVLSLAPAELGANATSTGTLSRSACRFRRHLRLQLT